MAAVAYTSTEAQQEVAFEQMRATGWPATLAALRLDPTPLATMRLRVVMAAAGHIARGGHPCRPDLSGPIRVLAKPAPHPLPARRHSDGAVDIKRIASGEKDED